MQIPVYQRGGTILPKKQLVRQASTLMINDPITLVVCLKNGMASGSLYMDDEKSFEYRNGVYLYMGFEFVNNTLTASKRDANMSFTTNALLERIQVSGLSDNVTVATLVVNGTETQLEITKEMNDLVTVVKPVGLLVQNEWTVYFSGARQNAIAFWMVSAIVFISQLINLR